MNKAELDSKPLAELHALAAQAGVPRYRMLPRDELVEKLAGGGGRGGGKPAPAREPKPRRERRPRRDSEAKPKQGGSAPKRDSRAPRDRSEAAKPRGESAKPRGEEPSRPKRKRRRRFGRRGRKAVRVQDMLLPAAPGRQAIVYAETREACTALLRELAAELSGDKGPDPVALLVDPSPEELADWKRKAPKAEIVSAGQERHAEDALAQAARRADSGEAVIFLIDSLSRFAEAFGAASTAKELFDGGLAAGGTGGGSLTVVAAVERPSE